METKKKTTQKKLDPKNHNHPKNKTLVLENKFRSDLYDILYKTADLILKKYEPCRFKNGSCFNIGCCIGCSHLSGNGCTVKALNCKLWLCDEARKKFPACTGDLDALVEIAGRYNLLGYRTCKKDVI